MLRMGGKLQWLCLVFAITIVLPTCRSDVFKRVVNGTPLDQAAWPWLVSLHYLGGNMNYTKTQNLNHLCAGSLLNTRWVLTAAHCFLGLSNVDEVGLDLKTNWRVVVGEHNRTVTDPQEQTIPVESIITHPDYVFNSTHSIADIALLKLARPARFGAAVNSIQMEQRADIPDKTGCQVAGWGQMHSDELGNGTITPHVTTINKTPRDECLFFTQFFNMVLDSGKTCFGSSEGKDSCQGDSGGPVVCTNNGKKYVTGIVSHGIGCGSNIPSFYTNVASYSQWVEHAIVNN